MTAVGTTRLHMRLLSGPRESLRHSSGRVGQYGGPSLQTVSSAMFISSHAGCRWSRQHLRTAWGLFAVCPESGGAGSYTASKGISGWRVRFQVWLRPRRRPTIESLRCTEQHCRVNAAQIRCTAEHLSEPHNAAGVTRGQNKRQLSSAVHCG